MYSKILAYVGMVAAVMFLPMPGSAKVNTFTDPVTYLDFNPYAIRYDPTPESVFRSCSKLKPASEWGLRKPLWVFAHVRRDGFDYYVLDGFNDKYGYERGVAIKVNANYCFIENSETLVNIEIPHGSYTDGTSETDLPGRKFSQFIAENHAKPGFNTMKMSPELTSKAEEDLLRDLLKDSFSRSERAWGAAKFKAALCTVDHLKLFNQSAIRDQEIITYCGTT